MNPRGRRRIGAFVLASAAVFLLSCDLSVAPGTVYSISKLLLPSPGVVVGDTMRDSTGKATALHVIAFATTGDSIAGTTPYFITLDTFAHLAGGTMLIGDHEGLARVVGGLGNVQTLPETVKVTLSPDALVAADSTHHVKAYSVLQDTLVTSADLATLVQHTGVAPTPVDAVIVKYSIVSMPASKTASPSVVLMNGSIQSSTDTTLQGRAARTLRLNVNRLTSANTDSAVVTATASYRGASIGTVQFTVIFKSQ